MKKIFFALLTLSLSFSLFAQQRVEEYDWDANPKHSLNVEQNAGASAVVLLDYRIREFRGDVSIGIAGMSHMNHVVIQLVDSKSIEEYNRVYIRDYGKISKIKARTIKPNGTIVELKEESIKEIEGERGYKIFAIEGIEAGDILEYLYKRDLFRDFCGIEIFQQEIPVQKAVLEMWTSNFFELVCKSYNGLSDVSFQEKTKSYVSETLNIPALKSESASLMNEHYMKAAYRVENVKANYSIHDVITWKKIAEYYEETGNVNFLRGSKKFLKEIGITDNMKIDEKIVTLEKYIKENFTYKDRSANEDNFKNFLKNRYGNEIDFTRATKFLLAEMNIASDWILSSDKDYIKIDPDFPNTTGLSEHLLYIPSTGKYLAMGYKFLRYGAPPDAVVNNYGLAIDWTAKVKKIKYNLYHYSQQNLTIKVKFDEDFTTTFLDKTQTLSGYRAISFRRTLNGSNAEAIKSITNDFMTDYMGEAVVVDEKVENKAFDFAVENKPLSLSVKIKASELIEDAGDVFIFNVGKLIGSQSDLYQETERKTPIEISYPIDYQNNIIIEIPKGYKVSGIKDCNIKNEYVVEGVATPENNAKKKAEVLAAFESTATIKENQVIINIHEFYEALNYSKTKYDEYRNVINSAADFNKLALIFEKE